ncbi:transaldolase family protein [Streptomyces atratus]|uniref:transaldolase family protein n=1 Tax=Streptomyces atratus TaxID=1893 RepID=UPI0022559942|nr:transaldolase family protein [Streptomyces atratus]MCX5339547.1 hypothetical protein [Streptomyces atratus]
MPAVKQGLEAMSACPAEGLSINVTPLFSLDRYDAVAEAFLTGMERAQDTGRDLSRIASAASFFVSRVDTETDRRLDRLGGGQPAALHGREAVTNSRIAYEHYERMLATERWKRLERAGARPQRLLRVSTGVKAPAYDATRYVVDLLAPGVVSTMPEATLNAVAEHGAVPVGSIRDPVAKRTKYWRNSPPVGVDYADVAQVLEDEGVEKSGASWNELVEKLAVSPHESDSGQSHRTDRGKEKV